MLLIWGLVSPKARGGAVAYFREKKIMAKRKCSTYDLGFYAVVQAIKHYRHYLSYKDFVLYSFDKQGFCSLFY